MQIRLQSELTSLREASSNSFVPTDPLSHTLYDKLEMLSARRDEMESFLCGTRGAMTPRGESDLPRVGSGESPRKRLHFEVLSEIREFLPALIESKTWLSVKDWVV
jgi:hypothetical protein